MNNYHIYDKLGKGKHSTVYKGRKKKTISYYAIKSVDKDQKSRVLQEKPMPPNVQVRTMHALDHKNVLKFHAWYETTNHLWLILEYCVGGDLLSLLRQDVRLPESSVHDFARDLMVSLQYLHSNSIIYCDLKPSNVLLDENGRLKLGGFGLSRRLSDINKTPFTSVPQAKRGTPCYMAPELFSDDAAHSTASDLWALGCVLYECAAGRAPFMSSTLSQLMQDILSKDPQPISGSSSEFTDLVMRLMDKNPATRIGWRELVDHPFWHSPINYIPMPAEPALEAFIAKHNLAPTVEEQHRQSLSFSSPSQAGDRARSVRQSVDITRLSKIALSNLEREGDGGSEYTAAEVQEGGVRIQSTDAEIDFGEDAEIDFADQVVPRGGEVPTRGGGSGGGSAREEEEEFQSATSVTSADDGSMIDQGDSGSQGGSRQGLTVSGPLKVEVGEADAMRAAAAAMAAARRSRAMNEAACVSPKGGVGPASELANFTDDAAGGSATAGGLEALIWHPSDTAVKPIVANRRIERLPEPKYESKALPFTPMTLQELLRAEHKDLEAFLTHIYRAIASAAPLKDKVNVLTYFETLCTDNGAANSLINSSLTILFIRMLRNTKAPSLRIKLASVLGLLVRHATYIAEELAQTSVIEILTEALKDKSEKVRRRVMATLGELLFYVATTQQDMAGSSTVKEAADLWQINAGTVSAVTRLLKPQEDEVAQHYAVKTIENICSQGGEWAAKFCSEDVVYNLVQVYHAASKANQENLKSTVASTLARLLRHSPSLVAFIIDKAAGVRLFASALSEGSGAKVQTAAVNMLNLTTSNPDLGARARAALGEERSTLVPALVALLDNSSLVLRAKALVALLLLSRLSPRWLLEACKSKLVIAMERLQRDLANKDDGDYLQSAVDALRVEVAASVPTICSQINEELSRPGSRKGPGLTGGTGSRGGSVSPSPLTLFPIILHLITSPNFRQATVTPRLIGDLAGFLSLTSGANAAPSPTTSSSTQGSLVEFKGTLMHVLEAMCQQTELLLQHYEVILSNLLPAVCTVVTSPAESGDTRFLCLRLVSEVTQLYLMDSELYGAGPSGSGSGGGKGVAADVIDSLLRDTILPTIPRLLQDEDPMPLYALKLLGGLLEVNPGYVANVESMGLSSQFFDFLSLEHANNNVHNIKLCRQVIHAGRMSTQELLRLQVADRVAAVVNYAAQNNVEPFLEPVLELSHTLMQRRPIDQQLQQLTAVFLDQAANFLELCAHLDTNIGRSAASCVLDLVEIFPQQVAPWLLSVESAAVVNTCLLGEHLSGGSGAGEMSGGTGGLAAMQALLLHALSRAVDEPGALPQPHHGGDGGDEVVPMIARAAQQVASSSSSESTSATRQAAIRLLQQIR